MLKVLRGGEKHLRAWLPSRRSIALNSASAKICGLAWGQEEAGHSLPARAWLPSCRFLTKRWIELQHKLELMAGGCHWWADWQNFTAAWRRGSHAWFDQQSLWGFGESRSFAREAHELHSLWCPADAPVCAVVPGIVSLPKKTEGVWNCLKCKLLLQFTLING